MKLEQIGSAGECLLSALMFVYFLRQIGIAAPWISTVALAVSMQLFLYAMDLTCGHWEGN